MYQWIGSEVFVRLYFHLKDGQEMIPDLEGVEVSGPQEARIQAILAIEELQREAGQDWSGWTLVVADESGAVLFLLDLANSTF